jgi:hypothetical protein
METVSVDLSLKLQTLKSMGGYNHFYNLGWEEEEGKVRLESV